MAIMQGALMPLVQVAAIDTFDTALSFAVPAAYFLVVAWYGYFDISRKRSTPQQHT